MNNKILNIKLIEIKPPRIIMSLVNKQSLEYIELKDSIKSEGILQNLLIRKATGKYNYELIAGLRRYTVAKDINLETVPCIIIETPTPETIIKQIQENFCRRQPSKLETSLHFKRLLLLKPELTFGDLAGLVHKSPEWVKRVLSLQNLSPEAKNFMEDNHISMTAAAVLSKLPHSIQDDLLDSSLELESIDFLKKCRKIRKAYKEAIRQGGLVEWTKRYLTDPVPALRTMGMLKHEYNTCICGKQILQDKKLKPLEIWKQAIGWVLHLDEQSIKEHYEKLENLEEKRRRKLKQDREPFVKKN